VEVSTKVESVRGTWVGGSMRRWKTYSCVMLEGLGDEGVEEEGDFLGCWRHFLVCLPDTVSNGRLILDLCVERS
jgi:hypothetical protein